MNLKKAIQMKPTFEVHYITIWQQMDSDLMQLKRNYKLKPLFYGQVRDFFVKYINISRVSGEVSRLQFIHGDIKPRVALQNILI